MICTSSLSVKQFVQDNKYLTLSPLSENHLWEYACGTPVVKESEIDRLRQLTYMSIRDVIKYRCNEQRLFPVEAAPGDTVYRSLYISQEIKNLIETDWPTALERHRTVSLQLDLERFVSDQHITVARYVMHARPAALLAQLYPPAEEVWEIRSVDPVPSLRVFGRFAEKDVFVALRWQHRGILGKTDSSEWDFLMKFCQHDWRCLVHPYPPHSGSYPHDYVTGAFFDRS